MSLKVMHHLGALPGISGHGLGHIERVEKTVGGPGEIDRRKIVRDIFGQLKGRVIIEIAREVEGNVEVASVDDLLPVPDVAAVLRHIDPDFLPALRQQIGAGVMRDRNVAHKERDRDLLDAGLSEEVLRLDARCGDVAREARQAHEFGFRQGQVRAGPHQSADIFEKG